MHGIARPNTKWEKRKLENPGQFLVWTESNDWMFLCLKIQGLKHTGFTALKFQLFRSQLTLHSSETIEACSVDLKK